jgi:DNA-directed RNA polymerase specialized sigma24 family protein
MPGCDGRALLRTWLHRIATNVCLDAPADGKRRVELVPWRGNVLAAIRPPSGDSCLAHACF